MAAKCQMCLGTGRAGAKPYMEEKLMEDRSGKPFALNAYQLKLVAIVAMLIDHLTWAFVPLNTVPGQLLHVIGRLTAPIMCYFLAEGFFYTRDLKKYIARMGVFALVSAVAFSYFESGGQFRFAGMGMIYTLFLGLLAMTVRLRTGWPRVVKTVVVVLLCMLSLVGDWPVMGVLWPYFFALYRGNPRRQFTAFFIVGALEVLFFIRLALLVQPTMWWEQLCQAGIFLAIPLLLRYDGTLGGHKEMKWFFYLFYPVHLFILGAFLAIR